MSHDSKDDEFRTGPDPWNYDETPDDQQRRRILLDELSRHAFDSVLDIGCGNGFITGDIRASKVVGVDMSPGAIKAAKARVQHDSHKFVHASIFDLPRLNLGTFDLIIVTGVLYPHYIGETGSLVYLITDELMRRNSTLVCVHIEEWYQLRFPYPRVRELRYRYRDYSHLLETYIK